jgi:hypothetical protein
MIYVKSWHIDTIQLVLLSTLLVGCVNLSTQVKELDFDGEVDYFTQDLTQPIKTRTLEAAKPSQSSSSAAIFPHMAMQLDQVSMEFKLSNPFTGWEIHNQSPHTIRFRFDQVHCVDPNYQALLAIPFSRMRSGTSEMPPYDKRILSDSEAFPIEVKSKETRWAAFFPKTNLDALYSTCSWRKQGETPKEIKDLSDLIGTEFAFALPYESEGKTGQYVFRLKIKNVGTRVSYH